MLPRAADGRLHYVDEGRGPAVVLVHGTPEWSNGWLWSLADDREIRRIMRVMATPLGRALYTRLDFSPRVLMKRAMANRGALPPAVHRQYLAPFPRARDREGPWGMAKAVLGSSAWYESLWAQRERITAKPTLVLWGMKDPAFRPHQLERWRANLRNAEVIELPAVGHFPQEEAPAEVVRRIEAFLARPA